MAWDETKGFWFSLGGKRFPKLARWKELSDVQRASRTGAIVKVDAALDAAEKASVDPSLVEKPLAAANLSLACDAMLKGIGVMNFQAKQRRDAVMELGTRAKAAWDYYAGSAPALRSILSCPTDILQMISNSTPVQTVVESLFQNFIAYARRSWKYSAVNSSSGEDLLAGRTKVIFCGGIAEAFNLVLEAILPSTEKMTTVRLKNYFVTKTQYSCFDPLVRGNIRDKNGAFVDSSCLFHDHFFLQRGALYYDPCMTATYTSQQQVVAEDLKDMQGTMGAAFVKNNPRCNDFFYVENESAPVHGFNGSYVRVKIADATNVTALQKALPSPLKEQLNNTSPIANAIVTFCSKVH